MIRLQIFCFLIICVIFVNSQWVIEDDGYKTLTKKDFQNMTRPSNIYVINSTINLAVAVSGSQSSASYPQEQISQRFGEILNKAVQKNAKSAFGYDVFLNYGWYKRHPRTYWENAKQICESEGAYLAVPTTEEEANLLFDISKHVKLPNRSSMCSNAIWIGVSDLETEGKYVTVKGTPLETSGFSKWATGEPNNLVNIEDCVSLMNSIQLNDCSCDWAMSFVCKKDI